MNDGHPGSLRTLAALAVASEDVRLACDVDVAVLITSASRASRLACARTIHVAGRRQGGPFVEWSPNGVPRSGPPWPLGWAAHFSADAALQALFERARRGTLFIDDVADLSYGAQQLLLTLLEDPAARSHSARDMCVRLIAGSDGRLAAARVGGTFSADLVYRLNMLHIDLLHEADLPT